jgi:hypothetical protein
MLGYLHDTAAKRISDEVSYKDDRDERKGWWREYEDGVEFEQHQSKRYIRA